MLLATLQEQQRTFYKTECIVWCHLLDLVYLQLLHWLITLCFVYWFQECVDTVPGCRYLLVKEHSHWQSEWVLAFLLCCFLTESGEVIQLYDVTSTSWGNTETGLFDEAGLLPHSSVYLPGYSHMYFVSHTGGTVSVLCYLPPLKSQLVKPFMVQLDLRKNQMFWAVSFTTMVEKVEFSRSGMSSVQIISYFWPKNNQH